MSERRLDANLETLIEKAVVGGPFGALVGLRCETIAEDRVRLRLPFRPELTTVGDLVHGGAIATLVDVAGTTVARSLVTYRLALSRG